ncbi:MAG: DUF1353 domain-containing protein [Pseudomonadota bacterium]
MKLEIGDISQKTHLYLRREIVRVTPRAIFILSEDLELSFKTNGKQDSVTVPAEFVTDLASVPRFLQWIVSKTDGIEASVVHDYIYAHPKGRTKLFADRLFNAMLKGQVTLLRRWLMYSAVRLHFWGGNF